MNVRTLAGLRVGVEQSNQAFKRKNGEAMVSYASPFYDLLQI
jgi:hypothetical protein